MQARYTAQQHQREQHAAALKVRLLEEQLAASAESARRRMEDQLETFRGDAVTARQAGAGKGGPSASMGTGEPAPDSHLVLHRCDAAPP